MPTQIIDGFKLNSATPIDSRLVTTGTESRNLMTYKYEGLRVYDTIQKTPFVYINGAWSEESGGVTTTSTTTGGGKIGGDLNYIPKITEYGGTTSSNIREYVTGNGNERWIGINVPKNKQIDATLHVIGASKFDGQVTATTFVGELPAANITGILALNKIANANDPKTYVLKSENNINKWVEETTGRKIVINKNSYDDKLFLVLSKDKDTTEAGNDLFIRHKTPSDLLAVNAETGQLMLGTTNKSDKPQYSFIDILNTGMYGNTSEIGLSMLGNRRIYVTSDMVGINIGTSTKFEVTSTLTKINTPTSIFGTTTINGATNITGKTDINGATNITGNTDINGVTTVKGETTVTGNMTITGNTTTIISQIISASASMILTGSLAILGANNGILVNATQSTYPPNKIINQNGTGLYVVSSSEGLRLDTMDGVKLNFITFFTEKKGLLTASGVPDNRKGWLGYGDQTADNTFYINNEVGEITLQPAATLPLNLRSVYYKNLIMYDDGIKLIGYSGHYWYFTQSLKRGDPLQDLPETQRIIPGAAENLPQTWLLYTTNRPQYMVPYEGSSTPDLNRFRWNNPSSAPITSNTMELINQESSKTVPPRAINKTLHDQWFMFRSKALYVRVMLNMNPGSETKSWVPINRPTGQDFNAWQEMMQGQHSAWSSSKGWTTDQFFIPGGWEFVIEIQKIDPRTDNAVFQGWGFSLGKVQKIATGGGNGGGNGGDNGPGGIDYKPPIIDWGEDDTQVV